MVILWRDKRKKRPVKDDWLLKLKEAVALLVGQQPLPDRFADNPLKGDWKGYRELHLEPRLGIALPH